MPKCPFSTEKEMWNEKSEWYFVEREFTCPNPQNAECARKLAEVLQMAPNARKSTRPHVFHLIGCYATGKSSWVNWTKRHNENEGLEWSYIDKYEENARGITEQVEKTLQSIDRLENDREKKEQLMQQAEEVVWQYLGRQLGVTQTTKDYSGEVKRQLGESKGWRILLIEMNWPSTEPVRSCLAKIFAELSHNYGVIVIIESHSKVELKLDSAYNKPNRAKKKVSPKPKVPSSAGPTKIYFTGFNDREFNALVKFSGNTEFRRPNDFTDVKIGSINEWAGRHPHALQLICYAQDQFPDRSLDSLMQYDFPKDWDKFRKAVANSSLGKAIEMFRHNKDQGAEEHLKENGLIVPP